MISAHSSADVCSRCTHSRKVSESSTAKTKANVAQAAIKQEQAEMITKVSETGEELVDIVVSNSWVKLVLATGRTFSCYAKHSSKSAVLQFTVPLSQLSRWGVGLQSSTLVPKRGELTDTSQII